MTGGWLRQLEMRIFALVPLLSTLALVLVDLLPVPTPGPDRIAPVLSVAAVYFWSIYRPDLLTPVAAFLIGLAHDSLAGLPLGATSMALLIVRSVLLSQQRFFFARSFVIVWLCFGLVVAAIEGIRWLVICIWSARLFPLDPIILRALLTTAAYPCVGVLLIAMHGSISRLRYAP